MCHVIGPRLISHLLLMAVPSPADTLGVRIQCGVINLPRKRLSAYQFNNKVQTFASMIGRTGFLSLHILRCLWIIPADFGLGKVVSVRPICIAFHSLI